MFAFARSLALPAALLAAGGVIAVSPPASAATTTLCGFQTSAVGGAAYMVQNNEWGSTAPECISTDGGADFTVTNSSIDNPTDSYPGGYPSLYKGCQWGACTPGSGLPLAASAITANRVTTSWSTSQPGGGNDYDAAYDIWFNQTPTTSGQPNGTELMIWLNHNGPVQPFGSQVASDVSIGGRRYDVWNGGAGLATTSFSVHVAGGGGPWPSPVPPHRRGPAPGRLRAAAISLAGIIVAIRQVSARLTRRGYDERERGRQAERPGQAERAGPPHGRRQAGV